MTDEINLKIAIGTDPTALESGWKPLEESLSHKSRLVAHPAANALAPRAQPAAAYSCSFVFIHRG